MSLSKYFLIKAQNKLSYGFISQYLYNPNNCRNNNILTTLHSFFMFFFHQDGMIQGCHGHKQLSGGWLTVWELRILKS